MKRKLTEIVNAAITVLAMGAIIGGIFALLGGLVCEGTDMPPNDFGYTAEEVDYLTACVYGEAHDCPERMQELVAAVVLNRVADKRFPGSVQEVLEQPGQYAGNYTEPYSGQEIYEKDPEEWERCLKAAVSAMCGQVDAPSDLVFQANFIQGSSLWEAVSVDTGYYKATMYFCQG